MTCKCWDQSAETLVSGKDLLPGEPDYYDGQDTGTCLRNISTHLMLKRLSRVTISKPSVLLHCTPNFSLLFILTDHCVLLYFQFKCDSACQRLH